MTLLPLTHAGTERYEEVFSESIVVPVEKERLEWHPFPYYSVMDCFVGVPILVWPMGVVGELLGLNHWESDCDRKGRETQQRPLDLGRPGFYVQSPK